MRAPAIVRQIRAFLTGYFWVPCPSCRRWFAGFERGGPGIMTSSSSGLITCSLSDCVRDVVEKETLRASVVEQLDAIYGAASRERKEG